MKIYWTRAVPIGGLVISGVESLGSATIVMV
jgi:hypothetical protein